MAIFGELLYNALSIFSFVLVARLILDLVRSYNSSWQPQKAIRVMAGVVYFLTDWILKLVRRLIPPLRIGPVALDLGVFVVFLAISFAQKLVAVYL